MSANPDLLVSSQADAKAEDVEISSAIRHAQEVDEWESLDRSIRAWWDGDVHTALEDDVRSDTEKTLLYLPHPYTTPGGSEKAFPEIYGWDTYYINCALLEHQRFDLVRNNIRNQLFQIDRYGMTLNGNRSWYINRSQPPLWTEGCRRYVEKTEDHDLLLSAYPLFKKEYNGYWMAHHHKTASGLTTNRDIGITDFPKLHAESETGLDFFSGYGGEVRDCNPLITNCILTNFTQNLAWMAQALSIPRAAEEWKREAERRSSLIRELMWDDEKAFFFDYNYVQKKQIPVWSLNAFWVLWAGIATKDQAAAVVSHLPKFLCAHGLTMTDREYPSPHPEFEWLQWNFPSGWPPFHIMVVEALLKYGYEKEARLVASRFLKTQIRLYQETGKLWEKYNVVARNLIFPKERYEVPPLHGWSSASVVLLGRLGMPPVTPG